MRERWTCRMCGTAVAEDGARRRVDRRFDGLGDVRGLALASLARRRDRGSPWHGGLVTVVTPLGQTVLIEVPAPEVR